LTEKQSASKVYLCHVAADQSFVGPFATGARGMGVEFWDARPGDEGSATAKVFVVIISRNSVINTQVRSDLNTAVKRQMSGQCKIVPIIIDDCPVPVSLQNIPSYRIQDIINWRDELPRIVHNFIGVTGQIPSPERPARFTVSLPAITELLLNDILVLFDICEQFREAGRLDGSFIGAKQISKYQITGPLYNDSLAFLYEKGHIRAQKTAGVALAGIGPTLDSFKMYAEHSIPDFDKRSKEVVRYIVNTIGENASHPLSAEAVALGVKVEPVIVDYTFRLLSQKKLAHVSFALNGAREIIGVTPQLRAWAARP